MDGQQIFALCALSFFLGFGLALAAVMIGSLKEQARWRGLK